MKVAFLDRDGVINKDSGYVYRKEDFYFSDDCFDALRLLQKKGFALIVVTNQSGIGRAYYTEDDYQQLTQWYIEALRAEGIEILDVFHCPHHPTADCDCRKPKSGLFQQAMSRYDIDVDSSVMVGDKISDMQAAVAAKIPTRFLLNDSLSNESLLDGSLINSSLLNDSDQQQTIGYNVCSHLFDCAQRAK